MCDVCSDFMQLLVSYEAQICSNSDEYPKLTKRDIAVLLLYVQTWPARQCMCCYRDVKNIERFSLLTQGVVCLCVMQLKDLRVCLSESPKTKSDFADEKKINTDKNDDSDSAEITSLQDKEKLFHLVSKIFLLNFPLYVAYKHTVQAKVEDVTSIELTGLNVYCDLHDQEIPIYLLRNVASFCKTGGVQAMTACFQHFAPDSLPVSTAHAIITIVCNLKLWLNFKTTLQMLVPLRSRVLRYMCRLADTELRTPAIKSMADFMWSAIKDPLDTPLTLDSDGLDLAFKYFTSSTLTMRLAGIAQINSHIGLLAELCGGGAAGAQNADGSLPTDAAVAAPRNMADWLINNNIISHIFGPNLHVEVIKQSHIILNFLAMEGRITCEHMDVIWAAAQLKHCSKPVHDLLPGLVKHLAAGPALHLYSLLARLEPREHTEQTLYLASALIKFIWTRGGASGSGQTDHGLIGLAASAAGIALHKCAAPSSSENSVSIDDGSNSEEEQGESSGQSESHKSVSDEEEEEEEAEEEEEDACIDSEGPSPCKQARTQCLAHTPPEDATAEHIRDDDTEKKATSRNKSSSEKRSVVSARKKILTGSPLGPLAPPELPEGVEPIASSSSGEEEEERCPQRRRMLRKRQAGKKSLKCKHGANSAHLIRGHELTALSDPEVDSEAEAKLEHIPRAKSRTSMNKQIYLEDSSSCSESGKAFIGPLGPHGSPCQPFIPDIDSRRAELLEILSADEMEGDNDGSYSSRNSNKSEKNMADFDGEESGCEEELAQLAAQAQLTSQCLVLQQHVIEKSPPRPDPRLSACFKIDNVCQPGNTLLWDLLQDNKIGQLGEGLALEAEKALCNLLCYNTDRIIRMKFIEGCLQNLANNWSVVISLRLLPKLLASFQQFRSLDTHHITHWADKQNHMMTRFFNNLKVYTNSRKQQNPSSNASSNTLNLYTHQNQVQVRLHFLSAVYSPLGSPKTFKLSVEQVDTLWQCLAHDSECSDELFSWLLSQAKGGEQHALGADALKRLYVMHLPSLPPESLSPTALALFQQLCSLARNAPSQPAAARHGELIGMDYLWKVALRANNTDVSMAAIQYLNNCYLSQRLQHEAEFVQQCMSNLQAAAQDLELPCSNEDPPLLRIQRALLLLKTHLDTFRRRYAYHLRRWAIDGQGIGCHGAMGERPGAPLRVLVQLAGMSERTPLDLVTTDFVADLRAEAAHVWETVHAKPASESESSVGVLGSLLHDGPIRMITQGQELTTDFDEKTLQEIGFKENQMVYISVGVNRVGTRKRDSMEPPSLQQAPPRDSVPMLLLLAPNYFEQLFDLMHTLSAMKTPVKGGLHIPHTKSQVLSRRVWDILTMLPTSPTLLKGFRRLDIPLSELLDPTSKQKLMYSLHIVEALGTKRVTSSRSCIITDANTAAGQWSTMFVEKGGLRHLFDIFMSGVLQRTASDGSEWQQDCLALLLKLLSQLGVHTSDHPPRNRSEKLLIPMLTEAMLLMMDVPSTMSRLMSIFYEASLPLDINHYKTGFWGRAQVVHYAMALLVSWLHCSEEARQTMFQAQHFEAWLQRLVLEEPEPSVRREVCAALYRLCLGNTVQCSDAGAGLAAPMLTRLLVYLSMAEKMRPQKQEGIQHTPEDGKEPYGPACRDYFWLVCRLVDGLPADVVKESLEDPQNCQIDINALAKQVAESILTREFLETRHRTVEDDGLIGLLNLIANLIKHHPPFQTSKDGKDLLLEVFDYLFALPTSRMRHVPKCKSPGARAAAFDLLVELVKAAPENYAILHEKLLAQHKPGPHSPYPWDYWPHDDGRSECGYVGLTNLGATCYMASCMQHLYMMPQARAAILAAECAGSKHEATLRELQRMFAYLLESERKAYNPRSFCKVYTMDHQPLNTGEQKDMAEFFIDLVSKLEEMTPQLKSIVKKLFCGVLSNNVVSLDCDHVSRTLEEFYTVRCQVADMRNLYESLDEVTVKDTLEGDNMYTCSQCGKKVRAEKRACFKKLPHILCFNTMRYTFNMVTMLKEKVNTHFSFPLRLNMAGYVEKQLMPQQYEEECQKQGANVTPEPEHYDYDLIGVTVHTGTADGGHYYSFIKDRSTNARDKWLLFNDAEVKPFDPNQIAAECFGGEMTSKTYDSVTDKFMDFSFEKTNSAYMLFYESSQSSPKGDEECSPSTAEANENVSSNPPSEPETSEQPVTLELSKELEDWIWKDNMHFIQDKNIFEHTYFNFMWQICGYIPQTLLPSQPDAIQHAAQLSTSFFIETFIHAKEKPTMVQWVELVTKQFNSCQEACEWFLEHMAADTWWPVQVLIKCPNQMVRQMFQRLCIHVIQRLRQSQASLYLLTDDDCEKDENNDEPSDTDPAKIGNKSCVTKFIKSLLSLMEHGAKAHLKHLTEYFGFLYEFCRMGDEETRFLISVRAIHTMVHFYLGHKAHDFVDVSDNDEEEEVVALPDKYKPASLDKMIALVAMLVEKSRGSDHHLQLSSEDYNAVAGGKGFPFLYQQIKDNINLQQTRNLIHSLCRGNERLASLLVNMLSQAISRHPETCQPFFKLLTLLTEGVTSAGPSTLPCFTQLVLQRVWEAADSCPHSALDWLALQVARSKLVHQWVMQSVDTWLEHFLIAHSNQRVRSAAAFLMVSLVPSSNFRQGYRARGMRGEPLLSPEAQQVLHQVYTSLLRLLGPAKHYTDIQTHGTTKLTAYFALLTYCVVSRTEKLMFGQYFMQLWHLFHPKLSEPSVPAHHNKQALLVFWQHVCTDCPENVQLMLHNAHVTKNIAFNYILADHDDQEVMMFNRAMLPAYYGLLRLCCQQSRAFTRHLAAHQNLQWAFKNITPHPTQYTAAVDELFKLMQLFVVKHPDATEQELREISSFRRSTLSAYLQCLDGRTCWATLISAFRILIDTDEDRLYIVYNGGLQLVFESLVTLHVMYHEATACHVSGELLELLALCLELVRCVRQHRGPGSEPAAILLACKDWLDALRKLATLLNTYNSSEMRTLCIDILKELVLMAPSEALQVLVPLLSHCHAAFQDSHNAVPLGPHFPRRGVTPPPPTSKAARPLRPMVQMAVPHNQIELPKGSDPTYDQALHSFYGPYHEFIDVLCRVAVNNDCLSEVMVTLSAMVGFEAVPLHSTCFPKLWLDILRSQHVDRKYVSMLTTCNYFVEYVDAVLLDERAALSVDIIYEFLSVYFPKVASLVLTEQTCNLISNLVDSLMETVNTIPVRTGALRLAGDLRALLLVYKAAPSLLASHGQRLVEPLRILVEKTKTEILALDEVTIPTKKRKLSNDKEDQSIESKVSSAEEHEPNRSVLDDLPPTDAESTSDKIETDNPKEESAELPKLNIDSSLVGSSKSISDSSTSANKSPPQEPSCGDKRCLEDSSTTEDSELDKSSSEIKNESNSLVDSLRLLESTIKELLIVVEKKHDSS